MSEDKREQVAKQCEAVAHMARALAETHTGHAEMLRGGYGGDITEIVGQQTAHLMETLGNILNDMDAVDDTVDGLSAVFQEAQRLWPHPEQ